MFGRLLNCRRLDRALARLSGGASLDGFWPFVVAVFVGGSGVSRFRLFLFVLALIATGPEGELVVDDADSALTETSGASISTDVCEVIISG